MTTETASADITPDELARERALWAEVCALVDRLSEEQATAPGYFDEDWSTKDMVAHIGTWMAEAGVILEQISVGTYRPEELDVDAMNARFLAAMRDIPLDVVRAQAAAARARMLRAWASLQDPTNDDAESWVRKAGPEHYLEHLPRLREWVAQLLRADLAVTAAEKTG